MNSQSTDTLQTADPIKVSEKPFLRWSFKVFLIAFALWLCVVYIFIFLTKSPLIADPNSIDGKGASGSYVWVCESRHGSQQCTWQEAAHQAFYETIFILIIGMGLPILVFMSDSLTYNEIPKMIIQTLFAFPPTGILICYLFVSLFRKRFEQYKHIYNQTP